MKRKKCRKKTDEKIYNALFKMQISRCELYKKLQESGLNITSTARITNTHCTTAAKYLRDGMPPRPRYDFGTEIGVFGLFDGSE